MLCSRNAFKALIFASAKLSLSVSSLPFSRLWSHLDSYIYFNEQYWNKCWLIKCRKLKTNMHSFARRATIAKINSLFRPHHHPNCGGIIINLHFQIKPPEKPIGCHISLAIYGFSECIFASIKPEHYQMRSMVGNFVPKMFALAFSLSLTRVRSPISYDGYSLGLKSILA